MKLLAESQLFKTESDRSLLSSGAWAPSTFNATAADPMAGLRPTSADPNPVLWVQIPFSLTKATDTNEES